MQIKTKGARVYLLRSTYDPTHKRSFQQVIGSACRFVPRLTPEVEQSLRPEELSQWQAYVMAEKESHKQSTEERTLASLTLTLTRFTEALAAHPELVDAHHAQWVQALAKTKTFINSLARKRRKAGKPTDAKDLN